MQPATLLRLVPGASKMLVDILAATRGSVPPPIRSEIFGAQRIAQHGRSLGESHRVAVRPPRTASFSPRLRGNIRVLREAHRYIGVQAATGYDISPAAEWLLDNFHLIEAQLKAIHEGMPRSYFRRLPMLVDEPLAGLPRVYGVAWAFVAHTDSAFDEDLLVHFLCAYQETRELKLSEMWALPTTLRVVLIENLRRLAERVATNKAAREVANLCCDRIDSYTPATLDPLLALLNRRGVGRVFLAQMAQRLHDYRSAGSAPVDEWLREALPDRIAMQTRQIAEQTADNLSVSNAVRSLRAIGDADWFDIIAHGSALMRLMLTSAVFEAEHVATRDQTLHAIEDLARQGGRSELAVAQALLDRIGSATTPESPGAVAGHWLSGPGRPALMQALGLRERASVRLSGAARRFAFPAYLGTLILGSLGLVAWMLLHRSIGLDDDVSGGPWALLAAALMLFPASEAVVAMMNRLVSESARPGHLPRLGLVNGIPAEHRVMVVMPVMLTSAATTGALVHRLLLHHLANPEPHAQFALLSDWADAATEHAANDGALLDEARERVRELNTRFPGEAGTAPRFIVLHRGRRYSESEQRWIGWERKRGKLEELVTVLAGGTGECFRDLGEESRISTGTRYVVTLDSDTGLPPGRLRELVGVAAHPRNEPRLDAAGRRVVAGYGILQPRIVAPLSAPADSTPYHWLFVGQCGIDPYSAASSEVYQDLFGEGTFTGKGLLNVRAVHAVLCGRLPEGRILSHDLLEGSIARCATVSEITVIEDAPFHADVAASRMHRWMRGDWQLLPFLIGSGSWGIRAVNRWKMFDNLRRSLVAPMSVALLLLSLCGLAVSPWAALTLVIAAYSAGPLLGALAGFSPSRGDLARWHFYREASIDFARAAAGGLWHVAQLLQHARASLDAIGRALWRMTVSHRHLLQWTTAAAAQASAKTGFVAVARQHRFEPVVAVLVWVGLLAAGSPNLVLATVLCLLWAGSPLWTWAASRPPQASVKTALTEDDRASLEGIARDTWRLFERCVGSEDNHLPPDNLQTMPHEMTAHRTSPTNIGLYLLSVACARRFGWIGTQELLSRLEATLTTLAVLPRHRGHFYNWYDTRTREPLLPAYVSTVDSGNLCGHLLAVSQACLELARAPSDPAAARSAVRASAHRLTPLRARGREAFALGPALREVLAMADPIGACHDDTASFTRLLQAASGELARLSGAPSDLRVDRLPSVSDEFAWCLGDHLATLASAALDAPDGTSDRASEAARRLNAVAVDCERLAWQADFRFLYHRKRHLLHIGYRVAERQLDAGFYDLLASESRLTSLLAIAKGDVPVRHWAALGRLFFSTGADAGLRSWSGSMFEYLMPALVLDEPRGSMLWDACKAALREQIDFASRLGLPWGMSESAYAGRDHTLAYQYAPQGVPRLALRRTPPEELVIAPYATALAAQIDARRAAANFATLQALGARARYGFVEALDYTPTRQAEGEAFTPVSAFMAHHQGMTIVALANVLLDGVARRWGMANAQIEAMASLLHERSPKEVVTLSALPAVEPAQILQRRAPGLLRDVLPGAAAIAPTHLLSNGRYTVTLRPNGAGWSRWGRTGLTRTRDDALRDAFGSFFYLRRAALSPPVSITQHPAPDDHATYSSVFHADRVSFEAEWPDLQAQMTVWVSPEDDIEFRQVEIRNLDENALDLELMSAFEVTLTDPAADESHPAFTSLFVRAAWQEVHAALVFARTPRLANEPAAQLAHFLADSDPPVTEVRIQTDRQRWQGRNRAASQPAATFDTRPATNSEARQPLDTGLDPVCALCVRLRIAPGGTARLTFATAASDNGGVLHAVMDKYRQPSHVQRASLMSATLAGIRLRTLRISAENFAAFQTLTTALVQTLTRSQAAVSRFDGRARQSCDRRLLWRLGISGDRPMILVSAGVIQGLGLLRSLAQALQIWSWCGIACDLVVINSEPASYQMGLHREILALREHHAGDIEAKGSPDCTGLHALRTEELSAEEVSTLQGHARIWLHADGRPLPHHVQEWSELHERAAAERREVAGAAVGAPEDVQAAAAAPSGAFDRSSGEFRFEVGAGLRPTRPWINVLSNPGFGAQISEAGGGYTWAVNSRLNQLTAWSNDPVGDPAAEVFLLQDLRTRQTWSVAPSACGDPRVTYRVTHGQGVTAIEHRRGDVDVTARWCVDSASAVKEIRLRIVNRGARTLHLRLTGIAEWMMGANRVDRGTVLTGWLREQLPAPAVVEGRWNTGQGEEVTALLCTQMERSAGFGEGTAFLAIAGAAGAPEDWTTDRRECFDAAGSLMLPDRFGRRVGVGLDPCAALSVAVRVPAGEAVERVFLLGYAETPGAARSLIVRAASVPPAERAASIRGTWERLLGAVTVATPDPLFDVMVNRWLLYQTVSCRLWAKAGFYQAGGATGFRDQLQDTMALAWAAPEMLRDQILQCASRQFAEGDVQHWWHAPTGAGVRTHFSDDLLWLALACVHYQRTTGDAALLDRVVPFLEGAAIPEGAEDAYTTPAIGTQAASVYEHAARAIDRSLRVGVHGLPLMGGGDWNDGMNRVGHEGRGESVWLGWFLCALVGDFAPIARARGDETRAQNWESAARGWKHALAGPAWDGRWFRRAFFDDGQPLGSGANPEARIDLIAQAWAVLSRAAPPDLQNLALGAMEQHLVDRDAGLLRLLDPPLVHALPSAGYIQAYPPGVRENGGQYSHGAVWALMAQAQAQTEPPDGARRTRDGVDTAYRYFTYLSPAHRSRHPARALAYGIEPYVMAGDVYTQPPYVGRGGWSWYTGAAAWMHRAAVESIFGLRQEAHQLTFRPCLPSTWPRCELTLRRGGKTMRFLFVRGADAAREALVRADARMLPPGEPLQWVGLPPQCCFVVPLPEESIT